MKHKETIKKNRAETAYKQHPKNSDRLLSKVMIGRFGKKVAALLYETNKSQSDEAANVAVKNPEVLKTSATIVVTQEESTKTNSNNNQNRYYPKNYALKAVHRCARYILKLILILTSKIKKTAL